VSSAAGLALTVPIALALAVPATASAVAAYRGWNHTLRRTGRLGVHTLAASSSDRAFALANRVAAPVAAGAAAVGMVTALIVLLLPLDSVTAVMIGVLGVAGMWALLYIAAAMGERAARTIPPPARKPDTTAFECIAGTSQAANRPDSAGAACGQSCLTCTSAADCRIAAMAPTKVVEGG
jgi:hypothetical protein